MDSRRWDDNHPSSSSNDGPHHVHYQQQHYPYNQLNYHHQQLHQQQQQPQYETGGNNTVGGGGYGYGQHVMRPQKFTSRRPNASFQSQPSRAFRSRGGGDHAQSQHHSRGHQGRHGASRHGFGSETGSNHSGSSHRSRRDCSNNSNSNQYRSHDDLRSDGRNAAGSAGHQRQQQQQQHHQRSLHSYRNSSSSHGGGSRGLHDEATPQSQHPHINAHADADHGPYAESMAANGTSADYSVDVGADTHNAFNGPTSSADRQAPNKRFFFVDDDDVGDGGTTSNTDADSLIHSILNESAAERFDGDEIVDTTPANPLVDLTDADELLQTFCSASGGGGGGDDDGGQPPNTDDDADGLLTPLTMVDPFLSSTGAPSTPLVPLGVHAKRLIAISTPANSATTAEGAAADGVDSADRQVAKKLINQLTRVNKQNLKQMINNPDGKYATALQTQARRKNREETRKQLRIISSLDTSGAAGDPEPDDCVDSSAIPPDIFEQIGRVLNVDFSQAFPPCDADAAAVFEPNSGLCGEENDFLLERLAEAERACDADDVDGALAFPALPDSRAANGADNADNANAYASVGESTKPRNDSAASMAQGSKLSIGSNTLSAAVNVAPNSQLEDTRPIITHPKEAILLTTEQPSSVQAPQSRKGPKIGRHVQQWSWKTHFLQLRQAIRTTELPQRLLESAIQASDTDRLVILQQIGTSQLCTNLLAGVYTNLPEDVLEGFRTAERSLKRYRPGCNWEIHQAKLERKRKLKEKSPKEKAEKSETKKKKSNSTKGLHKLWSNGRKLKRSMKTEQLVPEFVDSAVHATADDRLLILKIISIKMRNKLLSGLFSNLPEQTVDEFRTVERGLNRYVSNCSWEVLRTKLERKRQVAENSTLDSPMGTSETTAPATPPATDDPPISQIDCSILNTDLTTTALPDERSKRQRSASITSETPSSGPKHIRFDEPAAVSEPADIAQQPQISPETSADASTTVTHIRFDDPADVADTATVVEPPSAIDVPDAETATEPTAAMPPPCADLTCNAAVPQPPADPRPAAELIECDDGRFAERLCHTPAELRETLKHVPKHVRNAISKRFRELNATERRQKSGSQLASVQSDDNLEEDVIDVTPAVPAVDLTAGDDVDDGVREMAVAAAAAAASTSTVTVTRMPAEATASESSGTTAAVVDTVPVTEPTIAAIVTTSIGPADCPMRTAAAIPAIEPAVLPKPAAQPSQPPAVIVRSPLPSVVVRTPSPMVIPRTPTPVVAVAASQKTTSTPKTPASSKSVKKHSDTANKAATSKSKSKPENSLPSQPAIKTKASVKSTTKSHSRDTSRKRSASRERPTKQPPSGGGEQRLWRSPGEKKCVVSAAAAAPPASTGLKMPLPIGANSHRVATTSKQPSSKSSAVRANVATASAAVGNVRVLQRMKEIDRLLDDSMHKKMSIDQQIMELQQEKSNIESAQMGWHEERSQLLASLINGGSSSSTPADKRSEKATTSSTTTAKTKAASTTSVARPLKTEHSFVTARSIKTESGTTSHSVKSSKKRKAIDPVPAPAADVKRPRTKRPIDLTESDAEGGVASKRLQTAGRLFVEGPQLERILRDPGHVKLFRHNVDVIQQAPAAADNEVCTADETSLSDGSLQDDASFDGSHSGHRLVIVYVLVIGRYLVAASEDGSVHKYVWRTGQLVATFAHHKQTVTSLVQTTPGTLLSISLDGFVRQFQLKKFDKQVDAFGLGEPLQSVVYSWNTAFVGCRSGKITVLHRNEELNRFRLADQALCSAGMAVMSLVATTEGARHVLIVGARQCDVVVRDAQTGLLLRTIATPHKTTVYSLLLDAGVVHCGTNHNQLLSFDFVSGKQLASKSLAQGAVCLRSFGDSVLLCGCYDGTIYAIDKQTGEQICQIGSPGKMLHHFVLAKNRIIAATKNTRSLRMCKLPDEVLNYSAA